MVNKIIVEDDFVGQRLDVFLAESFPEEYSRSQIKKMISEDLVRVKGRSVRAHYQIKSGDEVEILGKLKLKTDASPEAIPLTILFEDEDLLVIDKEAGMVVHPANGNQKHTLVNALLHHIQNLKNAYADSERPGIVHRLDKDTSGVLVVAKHEKAHRFLAEQFRDHSIERIYYAVVRGVVQHDEGICEEPVGRAFVNKKKVVVKPTGGKNATTLFRVLKRFENASLLEVTLKTGRTHQIRVHMAHLGHPVLGDVLYGVSSAWITRQALHAKVLGFRHPVTHEKLHFESDLPMDFKRLLNKLEEK